MFASSSRSSDAGQPHFSRLFLIYLFSSLSLSLFIGLIWWRPFAIHDIFASNYLPHQYCYLAKRGLIWTHVVADTVRTFLSLVTWSEFSSPLVPLVIIFVYLLPLSLSAGLIYQMFLAPCLMQEVVNL